MHEDDALLVIDKPSGVAVHGGSGVSFGVIESLRAARPQAKFLELVHRLDRDTSGLLMLAKKRSALVELHRMLREGEVEQALPRAGRRALAQTRRCELRESLHKYVTASGRAARRVHGEDGQRARPRCQAALKRGAEFSLLEARAPDRPHAPDPRAPRARRAIRSLGDDKYGDFALNRELAKQGLKRMFLHAARLAFTHPLTGAARALEVAAAATELRALRATKRSA